MEQHLKPYQHYADLYDRHTVDLCRQAETSSSKETPDPTRHKGLTEEEALRVQKGVQDLLMYFHAGERYVERKKTIEEWIERDKKRDEVYESAEAPEDIRCLTCRNRLKSTFKELWLGFDKEPDRVLFMYDCPNKCIPRRAFFHDGEEWRRESDRCIKCSAVVDRAAEKRSDGYAFVYTCVACGHVEVEEEAWSTPEKKEDDLDLNFAKDRDRFCLTEEKGREYIDAKFSLENLGKLMKEMEETENARKEKLKEHPKGFHLTGESYTCCICGNGTPEGDNWYDEYGIKCLVCQKAIDTGEIPATVAKDRDSWYSNFDLKHNFNLGTVTLRKWIKEGIIKARTVTIYGEGTHFQLFLIKDNKKFLPPKRLLEGRSVRYKKDGKAWSTTRKWYEFQDPFKHLEGYKIMDYMRVIPPEEMKAREEARKKKEEERRARRDQIKKVRDSKKRKRK